MGSLRPFLSHEFDLGGRLLLHMAEPQLKNSDGGLQMVPYASVMFWITFRFSHADINLNNLTVLQNMFFFAFWWNCPNTSAPVSSPGPGGGPTVPPSSTRLQDLSALRVHRITSGRSATTPPLRPADGVVRRRSSMLFPEGWQMTCFMF